MNKKSLLKTTLLITSLGVFYKLYKSQKRINISISIEDVIE